MKLLTVAAIMAFAFSASGMDATPNEETLEYRKTNRIYRIVSAQKTISRNFLLNFASSIEQSCIGTPIEFGDARLLEGKDPMSLVKTVRNLPRTAAALVIVDIGDFPSVLVAPEDAWGILNIRPLKADKPDNAKLASRVEKELWRTFALSMGGYRAQMGPCLLESSVHTNEDLDRLTVRQLGPEATLMVMQEMESLGIEKVRNVSYEDACQEGWAHKPTNDVQKAIWDKVHALPANPIKILPETKKVTE